MTKPRLARILRRYQAVGVANRKTYTQAPGVGDPMTTTYTSNGLNQYRLLASDEPEIAPGLWYDADP